MQDNKCIVCGEIIPESLQVCPICNDSEKTRVVVRSVKPYWFYLICEGLKKAEVGKSRPKAENWNKVVYLYCSQDKKSFNRIPKEHREKYRKFLGKIGVRFVCNKIEDFHQFMLYPINEYEKKTIDEILKNSCLSYDELCDYIGEREHYKPFYIWHISNLVIYDKPRELSEFYTVVENEDCGKCRYYDTPYDCEPCNQCQGGRKYLTRPPQSWCYAEELKC